MTKYLAWHVEGRYKCTHLNTLNLSDPTDRQTIIMRNTASWPTSKWLCSERTWDLVVYKLSSIRRNSRQTPKWCFSFSTCSSNNSSTIPLWMAITKHCFHPRDLCRGRCWPLCGSAAFCICLTSVTELFHDCAKDEPVTFLLRKAESCKFGSKYRPWWAFVCANEYIKWELFIQAIPGMRFAGGHKWEFQSLDTLLHAPAWKHSWCFELNAWGVPGTTGLVLCVHRYCLTPGNYRFRALGSCSNFGQNWTENKDAEKASNLSWPESLTTQMTLAETPLSSRVSFFLFVSRQHAACRAHTAPFRNRKWTVISCPNETFTSPSLAFSHLHSLFKPKWPHSQMSFWKKTACVPSARPLSDSCHISSQDFKLFPVCCGSAPGCPLFGNLAIPKWFNRNLDEISRALLSRTACLSCHFGQAIWKIYAVILH